MNSHGASTTTIVSAAALVLLGARIADTQSSPSVTRATVCVHSNGQLRMPADSATGCGPSERLVRWVVDGDVNDVRVGAAWTPPYRVPLGDHLVAGKNMIRIDVANLATNAMAARALPDYRLLNLRYGLRFEPQDMDQVRPMPSGLLGPIRLVWEE